MQFRVISTSWGKSYPYAEARTVYTAVLADRAALAKSAMAVEYTDYISAEG